MTNGAANLASIKLVFGRNSVDQPIYPRRGSEFSASVQATLPYSLWDGKDYKKLEQIANSSNSTSAEADRANQEPLPLGGVPQMAVQGAVVPVVPEKLEPRADAQGRNGIPRQLQQV